MEAATIDRVGGMAQQQWVQPPPMAPMATTATTIAMAAITTITASGSARSNTSIEDPTIRAAIYGRRPAYPSANERTRQGSARQSALFIRPCLRYAQ